MCVANACCFPSSFFFLIKNNIDASLAPVIEKRWIEWSLRLWCQFSCWALLFFLFFMAFSSTLTRSALISKDVIYMLKIMFGKFLYKTSKSPLVFHPFSERWREKWKQINEISISCVNVLITFAFSPVTLTLSQGVGVVSSQSYFFLSSKEKNKRFSHTHLPHAQDKLWKFEDLFFAIFFITFLFAVCPR